MTSVIKANGDSQTFSESKILESIRRAGISADLQTRVLEHVKNKLRENIPTSEIYHHITEFLENENPFAKTTYSLKHAIMELGPTGHPFEDYAASILQTQGYTTTVRSTLLGKCISHEVDVIAQKENTKVMVEVKFHNTVGIKTDVQVALYTQARFEDLQQSQSFSNAGLITNTKPTSDVIAYAECSGMKLLSWDYPEGDSIRDIVNKFKLYPITVLTSLSQLQKQELLNQGIIMTSDICKNTSLLESLHLSQDEKRSVIEESQTICSL